MEKNRKGLNSRSTVKSRPVCVDLKSEVKFGWGEDSGNNSVCQDLEKRIKTSSVMKPSFYLVSIVVAKSFLTK